MVQSDEGARVIMFNGSRQDFDKTTKQLSILYFDRYVFELEPPSAAGQTRHREARERSMADLFDLDTTGLNTKAIGKFHVEIHRRLALPWTALGFVMIALSVLMSGSFTRRGEGTRVFVAILLAGGYQGGLLATLNAAAKNETLIPLIYAVAAAPVAIGAMVLLMPGMFQRKPGNTPVPPRNSVEA